MRRKIYFWVKENVNSDTVRLAILAIPLTVVLVLQIVKGEINWMEFLDVSILVTFVILAVCDAIANLVQKIVSEKAEDSAKLITDYKKLTQKYQCTNLISYVNAAPQKEENKNVLYPEECLWMRTRADEQILIQDEAEKFYNLPAQVMEHSGVIMEAHRASTVYNQINIRLDDLTADPAENTLTLCTSRTQYFDSLLTNRACDYVFSDRKITIREMFEPGPYIKPLSLSKMSNHLGFNGFVMTSDRQSIPFILRRKNMSIGKGLWGTSIGASLKTMYALDAAQGFKMNETSLGRAIIGELKDELNIKKDRAFMRNEHEYDPRKVQDSIFAFYRDLVECGKPQFLFCLQLENTTEAQLSSFFAEKGKKDKNDVKTDGDEVRFFTIEQLKNAEYHIDKIVIDGNEYPMSPSYIISVILLLEYMKNRSQQLSA
ncbi:MAG: hypothetical protein IJN11_08015 [Oscillospiraceae bacterium]|nr:hypothetical protein [Oscillospiraceae bacterium]